MIWEPIPDKDIRTDKHTSLRYYKRYDYEIFTTRWNLYGGTKSKNVFDISDLVCKKRKSRFLELSIVAEFGDINQLL